MSLSGRMRPVAAEPNNAANTGACSHPESSALMRASSSWRSAASATTCGAAKWARLRQYRSAFPARFALTMPCPTSRCRALRTPFSEWRPATWCTCLPVNSASALASTASTSASTVGATSVKGLLRSMVITYLHQDDVTDIGTILPMSVTSCRLRSHAPLSRARSSLHRPRHPNVEPHACLTDRDASGRGGAGSITSRVVSMPSVVMRVQHICTSLADLDRRSALGR